MLYGVKVVKKDMLIKGKKFYSFILLSIYYVPGNALGTGNANINWTTQPLARWGLYTQWKVR